MSAFNKKKSLWLFIALFIFISSQCLSCNFWVPQPTQESRGVLMARITTTENYWATLPVFLMTCSISAMLEVSRRASYLARIFKTGLSLIHHCSFGIRCLQKKQSAKWIIRRIHWCQLLAITPGQWGTTCNWQSHKHMNDFAGFTLFPTRLKIHAQYFDWNNKMSHSKSTCSLRSVRGWKIKDLFFMPSTQAESLELAKMRPGDLKFNTYISTWITYQAPKASNFFQSPPCR